MSTTLTREQRPKSRAGVFLGRGREIWHRSVPQSITLQCTPGDDGDAWRAFAAHLAGRKKPASLEKLLSAKTWPLIWALPDEVDPEGTLPFVERLAGKRAKSGRRGGNVAEEVGPWLAEAAEAESTAAYGLECLALAHAMPWLSEVCPAALWWELLEHLVAVSTDDAAVELTAQPVAEQLLTGELPLTLSYVLPELKPCRELAESARRTLSAGIVELLDGEGVPHASQLRHLRPLLACWTRCRAMGSKQKRGCFTPEAKNEYEWFVRAALQFARHDGSLAFSGGSAGAWEPELFAAALRWGGNDEDRAAAAISLPTQKKASRVKALRPGDEPSPAVHSEWSRLAVMRPDWSRRGPRLAADYMDRHVALELDCGRGVAFSGVWDLELEIGGKLWKPCDEWEDVCWESDDDVDYLELEVRLGPVTGERGSAKRAPAADRGAKVRVQRQILMAREDHFLYLADNVLGLPGGNVTYRTTLPLAPGIEFVAEEETREGWLVGKKRIGLVMPLALPEWRTDSRHGSLAAGSGGLELRQTTEGSNLCCPLFVDLDPRRCRKAITWRQLTVAEKLEIVPRDVAVGYRVQSAGEQWLFYRSLGPRANRSLLAQNLSTEFLAARFNFEGDLDELLEIE